MILRDPVHGLVCFEDDAETVISALLGTRELQRLRRVRQLGLTALVFPGAEHSRFAHALGAAHVMVRLHERVWRCQEIAPPSVRLDRQDARDSLAAAVLHDLGHGPFSHLFEEVTPEARPHESWSREIIEDPDSEVHRALEGLSAGMSTRVAALLSGTHPKGWIGRAVSGTLDVDRCDYLLRDSRTIGVAYGLYDLDWLLRALTFAQVPDGEWVLAIEGRKGLPPIEGFFLARHFMFQQVYHHKATRAAEALIRGIFRRLQERIRDGSAPPATPPALRAAILGESMDTNAYLALDDSLLMSCLAQWEGGKDEILAAMASDLRHRRLPKTIPLPDRPEAEPGWREALQRAQDIAHRRGLIPHLHVRLDRPSFIPYPEPVGVGVEGLWVRVRRRPLTRLGDISFLLRQLRNETIVRPRLIIPASIREEVERAVEGIWDETAR